MMAKKTTEIIETIKNESIQLYNGMVAVFSVSGKEVKLDVDWAPMFNEYYTVENSTAVFVHEEVAYATAYRRDIIKALIECGFREEQFHIPLSKDCYPKYEKDRWMEIIETANCYSLTTFAQRVADYCDRHDIGTLMDETLQNCFQIPETGIKVKKANYRDIYYPLLFSDSRFETERLSKVGGFCTNKGNVIFVYRDGKTYVTKGYNIIPELRNAGYIELNMFVPFSNHEEITDCELKRRWEAIKRD